MSIVQDLLGEKLFVLVNMSLFFNSNDLQSFINTVNVYKYNVLLIDGVDMVKLNGVRRLIIDKDLCII
jgi:CRISPR type II-A-associated protein Csn2